jgi:hypothetical protein
MGVIEQAESSPPAKSWMGVRSTLDVRPAAVLSIFLLALAVVATVLISAGNGFVPRVGTIDALAGLVVGAFAVDRLLTFIPASSAHGSDPDTRALDVDTLRWGWGALLGAVFVAVTGLEAVAAMTGTDEPIDATVDRVIAVLAIAGGVKGLARFKDAVHPPPKTKGDMAPEEAADDPEKPQPPPAFGAYAIGLLALVVAGVLAAIFAGGEHGLELLGVEEQADSTMAVVVRFGPVLVAAVVVEQVVERSFASSFTGPAKKLLTGAVAVVLAVILAGLMDLYLMHVIGFFGTEGASGLDGLLAASGREERALDILVTGLVIASGTTALHDVAAMLKSAKES